MKKNTLLFMLALIMSMAFILRVIGITCGLPTKTGRFTTFHFDEYVIVEALGNINPSTFNFYPNNPSLSWGTFFTYFYGVVLKASEKLGIVKLKGKDFFRENLEELNKIYIVGRLLIIGFSILSVLLIFLIGKRLFIGFNVLIPALFLSISYVDIYISSLLKPDSVMLFWGLASFYFFTRYLENEISVKYIIFSAICVGLSFSSKYTGLVFSFFAFSYFLLSFLTSKKLFFAKLSFFYAIVIFIVFLIVNPYFLIKMSDELSYMSGSILKAQMKGSFWGYKEYLFELLPVAFGWPLWLFYIISLIYSFIKPKREIVYCSFFILLYILKFGGVSQQVFTYSLPVVPFLALVGGYFVEQNFSRNFVFKIVFILIVVYSFSYCFYHKFMWNDNTTVLQASKWSQENISKNSAVCVSRIDVWTPPVFRRFDTPYTKLFVATLPSAPMENSLKELSKSLNLCEYLILSEFERIIINQKKINFVEDEINKKFDLVKKFERQKNSFFVLFYSPHYLTANIINPTIEIYKRR